MNFKAGDLVKDTYGYIGEFIKYEDQMLFSKVRFFPGMKRFEEFPSPKGMFLDSVYFTHELSLHRSNKQVKFDKKINNIINE